MSTSSPVQFGHRCTTCYQLLLAGEDEVGAQTICPYCGQQVTIPEATAERIALAENNRQFVTTPPEIDIDSWTDADIERELKRELYVPPGELQTLANMTSATGKRLLGWIIDNVLLVAATVAGLLLVFVLDAVGLVEPNALRSGLTLKLNLTSVNVLLVLYFLPAVLCVFQWWLITTRGQSIGKLAMGMRIVAADGSDPGFLQGVVLRNWLRALLSMLPFFALGDVLFIFGDSHRCIHDYLAGTYVVDV